VHDINKKNNFRDKCLFSFITKTNIFFNLFYVSVILLEHKLQPNYVISTKQFQENQIEKCTYKGICYQHPQGIRLQEIINR